MGLCPASTLLLWLGPARRSSRLRSRAPGAPSLADLKKIPGKAEYLHGIYSRMHRKIFAHDTFIDASNVEYLRGMDFVFLCLDKGRAKQVIVEKLEEFGIPFVDIGMGVELVDDSLIGVLRVTTSTEAKRDHVRSKNRIAFTGDGREDLYSRNAEDSVRREFLAALEDNPPAAVLLTNSQWSQPHGFDAATSAGSLAALRARTPEPAWERRAVGEGDEVLPESRMREICL